MIVVNIISGIVSGFMLLSYSLVLSLISFAAAGIGIVPFIMILRNSEDIESLRAEVSYLRGELHKMQINDKTDDERSYSLEYSEDKWQCIKCKAVNPKGTNKCSNCGDFYSSKVNPPNKYR